MSEKRILVVHSSPDSGRSISRALVRDSITRLREPYPHAKVTVRDLVSEPPPHYGSTQASAGLKSSELRTSEEIGALALSDSYAREVLASDIIIIGSPMWNFSVPSVLKAWIDHIVRAGVTFRYTEHGSKGLLSPEASILLVESTGALYDIPEDSSSNHVGPWLAQVFRFLGAKKITLISAQGTAMRNPEIALAEGRTALAAFIRSEHTPFMKGLSL